MLPEYLYVYYLMVDDLPDLGIDSIHLLYPCHLILCFELLGDSGLCCYLLHQPIMQILCLLIDICQMGKQLIGQGSMVL